MRLNLAYRLASIMLLTIANYSFSQSTTDTEPTTPPSSGEYSAYTQQVKSELSDGTSILQQISNEIVNFGSYFGFDLLNQPTATPNSSLTNMNKAMKYEIDSVEDLFATLSINFNYASTEPFIANSVYNNLNQMANLVFNQNSSSSTSQNTNNLNSPQNISTPVAQMLQNILSVTPDSYCYITRPNSSNCNNRNWQPDCTYPYTISQIYANAWGFSASEGNVANLFTATGPAANGTCSITTNNLDELSTLVYQNIYSGQLFFPSNNQNYNQLLLNQLDSSLLTTPLLYDDSSQNSSSSQSYGLATNSAQQAAENYIQYVTGNVLPPQPVSENDLQTISQNIFSASDIGAQLSSFRALSQYFLGMRVYASRVSVAIQNIYEILGSRIKIPSDSQDDQSNNTSQALNEFKMATYRLYNPKANLSDLSTSTTGKDEPWQQMINNASPATIQKETAILLAEINYQLYLMRKQQEKLLLTNSVMLLQSTTAPYMQVPETNGNNDGVSN